MPHIDSSGVAALEALRKRFSQHGKALVLCEFNGPCRDILARLGGAIQIQLTSSVKAAGFIITLEPIK
jgi:anti-anti-sigma regulatory factor